MIYCSVLLKLSHVCEVGQKRGEIVVEVSAVDDLSALLGCNDARAKP